MIVFNTNIENKAITVNSGGLPKISLDTNPYEKETTINVKQYPVISYGIPAKIDGGIIF